MSEPNRCMSLSHHQYKILPVVLFFYLKLFINKMFVKKLKPEKVPPFREIIV